MTPQDELLYERELQIAASPETIFPFLIEPEKLIQWMGIDATLEARPRGIFRVEVRPDNIARGEFVQIEPNSRVVFTWGWEQGGSAQLPPGSTRVEITLIPNERGTTLRLVHSGFYSEEERDGHGRGWDLLLPRLVEVAEGREPGPDPWTAAEADSVA